MKQYVRFVERLAPHGDFKKIFEIDSIIDNILKSLSIPKGSYIADPEVGSELFKYVYELFDDETLISIEDEIRRVISEIEKVHLRDIRLEVTPDKKGLVAKLTIDIEPGISKVVSIIITKEYIDLLNVEEIY